MSWRALPGPGALPLQGSPPICHPPLCGLWPSTLLLVFPAGPPASASSGHPPAVSWSSRA
jgi:hypothetical protein